MCVMSTINPVDTQRWLYIVVWITSLALNDFLKTYSSHVFSSIFRLIKRFQIFFFNQNVKARDLPKIIIRTEKKISGRCRRNLHRTRSIPGISLTTTNWTVHFISAVNVAPQHRHVQKLGNIFLTNRQYKDIHFIYGLHVYWFVHLFSLNHFNFLCLPYKSRPRVCSHVPACLISEGKNMPTIFFLIQILISGHIHIFILCLH